VFRRVLGYAAALALLGTSAADAAPRLPLDNAGRWIVDADGRVVVLHGQNLIATAPPWDALAAGFGADDAALLRGAGFNTMRIGPLWGAAQPEPGRFDDAYLRSFAAQVRLLNRYGITPLVDFHQDGFGPAAGGTDGAPAWATDSDGTPACPNPYHALPCGKAFAWDHFWANDGALQDRYASYVARVIASLRGLRVAGYDLMNEPEAGRDYASCFTDLGCPDFERRRLGPFYDRVMRAARGVAPRALLFREPVLPFGIGAPSSLPGLDAEHAGLSVHTYCGRLGLPTLLPGETCEGRRSVTLDRAERLAGAHALLVTEFGSTNFLLEQLGTVRDADRRRLGWIEWSYWNPVNPRPTMTVFDVAAPPAGTNLDALKLRVLTRVYPQAVAGTPRNWSFDEIERRFAMRWTSRRVATGRFGRCAVTEIRVPPGLYPEGYRVSGRGIEVISRPDAPVLRLRARRRDHLMVTVQPGARSPTDAAAPRRPCGRTPRGR
jgi:endoglycosylceramidase